MKTLEQLQPLIIDWANDKKLLDIKNAVKQAQKTQEELDELKLHIGMQELGITEFEKDGKVIRTKDAIKDDIGDTLVTLIIQCKIQEVDLLECLNLAWNEIKDRTGQTINGTFKRNK